MVHIDTIAKGIDSTGWLRIRWSVAAAVNLHAVRIWTSESSTGRHLYEAMAKDAVAGQGMPPVMLVSPLKQIQACSLSI